MKRQRKKLTASHDVAAPVNATPEIKRALKLGQGIKHEHEAARRAQYASIVHARKMGELLIRVEEQVGEETFSEWLLEQPFGACADLHMALHREWNGAIRRAWDGIHDGEWAEDQRSKAMNLWGARHLAEIVYRLAG